MTCSRFKIKERILKVSGIQDNVMVGKGFNYFYPDVIEDILPFGIADEWRN